jgi:hypothetical protein
MHVRPTVPGAVIRDPVTQEPLPQEGGRVTDSTFWRRRRQKGEVVECEPPAKGGRDKAATARARDAEER